MTAGPPAESVLTNAVTGVEFRIVRSGRETGGELLEMVATYPPASAAPPAHFHPEQHESFRVLAGAMRVAIGGAERTLAEGETLEVPAGTVHAMWNPGPGPARVNWQTRPALRTEEFFRAVFALAARGRTDARGTPRLLDLALLVPSHWREIRVARPSPAIQRIVFALLGPIARLLGRGPGRDPSRAGI